MCNRSCRCCASARLFNRQHCSALQHVAGQSLGRQGRENALALRIALYLCRSDGFYWPKDRPILCNRSNPPTLNTHPHTADIYARHTRNIIDPTGLQHRPNRGNDVMPNTTVITPRQHLRQQHSIGTRNIVALTLNNGLGDGFVLQQNIVFIVEIKAA